MGKISLFSLASPNSFEFYRVDSHHSSAAALASPAALWLSQDSCRSFNPKLTSWNPLKASPSPLLLHALRAAGILHV